MLVSFGCPGRKIVIGGIEENIDLAVLAMFDFDVIIGMDWLVRQKALMDCGSRTIQFNLVGRPKYEFQGNRGETSIPWIASLEATKLMDDGCEEYLVNVVDSTIEGPSLEEIPVVCNFPEVFPQELPGLPPGLSSPNLSSPNLSLSNALYI
ncbi:hypothetical protein NL676_012273 [Syzygium grande]|nr:hypothetical protein NL676_012273 [Syzygium grande]